MAGTALALAMGPGVAWANWAEDSTYVTGRAPVGVVPAPSGPGGALTLRQLLDAMQGSDLYFREYDDYRRGYAELPAFVRVRILADRAELQLHHGNSGWRTACSVTADHPVCGEPPFQPGAIPVSPMTLRLLGNGFYLTLLPCPVGEVGQRDGQAYYTWESFQTRLGAFSQRNRQLQGVANGYAGYWMQGGRYHGTCKPEGS